MSSHKRDQLAAETLVATVPGGKIVIYRGEVSNMAYFILKGSATAGYIKDDDYFMANTMRAGDFFGEIAALTGAARSANVITEEESELLIIPATVMRRLASQYEGLRRIFYLTIEERLTRIELPRGTGMDQQLLRELRTSQPDREPEPAPA